MRVYSVGGAIRDELLGRPASDKDFVVLGCSEADFLARFPEAKRIGGKTPVFIIQGQEYTLSKEPDILSDLRRRDLTVNALARDEHGRLHALDQSLKDLEQKQLRPVLPENFMADPLRVYRAARLAASLPDFSVHEELLAVMRSLAGRSELGQPTAERVGLEVRKACASSRPGRFMDLLARTGTLLPWLQEVFVATVARGYDAVSQNAPGLLRLTRLLNRLAGDELLVWMALCHNFGSGNTSEPGLSAKAFEGDDPGASQARHLARRLRLPRRFRRSGALSAYWCPRAVDYPDIKAGMKVELLEKLESYGLLERMFSLIRGLSGRDSLSQARADLERIKAVSLPEEACNLGPESGRILRAMRRRALSHP